MSEVYFICLTGGPCAGKTSALARLRSHFSQKGFRVYLVPEAATMFWENGCTPTDLGDADRRVTFQTGLMRLQLQLENSFASIAVSNGTRALLLCDRGGMDGKAYMSDDEWGQVLQRVGVSESDVSGGRYDTVVHLVSAADGAPAHYSAHDFRHETVEEAVQTDHRTREVWQNHPRRQIIDNSTDFEGKLTRVVDLVTTVVEKPPVVAHSIQ